jgi:CRISPR-associated protein Csm1
MGETMNKFNKKEYQTVILAALLHDVGKFMNRGETIRRKHPLFSADYVSTDAFKKLVQDNWIDLNLLKTLVQRHHEYFKMPDELLVQKIDNPHTRALAYIVSRADTYSSGERLDEEPSELDFKNARLMSILTRVKIGKGASIPHYYNLQRLSPKSVFPVTQDKLTQLSHYYDKLYKEFGEEFAKFKPNSFDALFNGYLSLFEKFLWCVPSDTRERYNDISLYDHLSSTSAIAACLYQYHSNNLDESAITNDNLDKCMLVGGDLSGIQRFIFEIGSTNPKKLSKVLRGRSFYLSLLIELASLKILRRLHLPISCRIMNAGGRFVLLVPNTPFVKVEIEKLKEEIDNWFYERFLGKLSLNMAWGIALSKDGFTSEGFSKKQRELSNAMELSKRKRFNNILISGYESLNKPMKDAFETLQKDGEACEFCKIYSKINGKSRCQTCLDSEEIGEFLVFKPLAYFYEGSKAGEINIMGYTVSFESKGDDWVLLEKIGGEEVKENNGYIERHISNYIPKKREGDIHLENEKPKDGNTLCRYCGSPCKLEGDEEQDIPPRKDLVHKHLTFQCISASTIRNNSGRGLDHLAVVKADVDDLGFIFSQGLGDAFSISRYASLSRMLNYFFTGWLTNEIKENHRMAYTVYAGGDDLLLIAPWEDALHLGSKIGVKFKSYTGENPNITISMGINLMRPNSPVGLATEGAEENLEKSKENKEKNKLTVFGTTVRWDEFNRLKGFMDSLNNAFTDKDEKVNASFLYRMLKYHEMYKNFAEKDLIEGLKFHSTMTRDVRRNIERRDKQGNILNPELIKILQPLYEIGDGFDKALMNNLKIPVFWTLYKNRGGAK